MESKAELLARFRPLAVLTAETPEAARALPSLPVPRIVPILRLPFRIGRESRVQVVDGEPRRVERAKRGDAEPNNDLYLVDVGEPLHLSREHCAIDRGNDGYILLDRGSACGLGVGTRRAGGRDAGGVLPLRDGDVIALGTDATPYRYRFIVLE